MIRFSNVQGDVLVDDRRRDDRRMAHEGLTLDADGDYLVATTQASSTDVHAYGKYIRLGSSSYLRLGGNRAQEGRHNELWSAKNTKHFLARVWALAGGR